MAPQKSIFLGIDGGGTSCRLVAITEDGQTILEARAGPANALVVGFDRARESLDSLWRECQQLGHIAGVVVGLAGADRPALKARWVRYFKTWSVERFWLVGDYRIAWAALTAGAPGLVAILGTGSIVYAEDGQRSVRKGGFGWQLGDVGSGIWLGSAAVKAALGDWEGTGPKTQLTTVVASRWPVEDAKTLLAYWYGPEFDVRTTADLAQDVLALAPIDTVTERLIRHAAAAVVGMMLSAMGDLVWRAYPVGVAGGLSASLLPWLKREWWSHGRPEPLELVTEPAQQGAAHLARMWTQQGREADGAND